MLASYQSGNTLQIQQLALYTRNGIVANPSIVQQFLNNHISDAEAKRKFYVNQSTVTNHGITVNIDFLERNRVRMNGRLMEITQSTDSILTISAYDSTDMPLMDLSPCGLVKNLVPQIAPGDNCGGGNCLKYRQTMAHLPGIMNW